MNYINKLLRVVIFEYLVLNYILIQNMNKPENFKKNLGGKSGARAPWSAPPIFGI